MATVRLTASQRRRRILDAAAEQFSSHGYHSTSVQDLARAAGVTKPVLYDHFPSKRDVYVAVIEGARDELTARGAAAMGAGGPSEERIRNAIDAFFAYVEEHPAAARVLLTPPLGDPELLAAARRVQEQATGRLSELLAAEPQLLAGARDRRRRLELITEFIKTGMHGLADWWSEHPRVPRRLLVDATMQVVWGGVASAMTR